jgi:DMSO/TMAO reductase YedYZ molybdopterin-dependent catalytic subunit
MALDEMTRRRLLKLGGATAAGLSVLRIAGPAAAFQTPEAGEVIPWLDQPAENPVPDIIVKQLTWEELDEWQTPTDQFFAIKHYNLPELNESDYRLEVSGLVSDPRTLTLAEIMERERSEVTFTMECSGNTGLPLATPRGPVRPSLRSWKK